MTATGPTTAEFSGSIPDLYELYLVPMIFQPYARDLARRVVVPDGGRVVEIAAGTGAVTRELARNLPASVEIVATDLNQPMLNVAAQALPQANVVRRQADVCALPLADGVCDAAICQFGVMFFPDRRAAFREMRRVLTPAGRLVFNVWDRLADNVFTQVVQDAVGTLFPADPPRFFERTPHGCHDIEALRADLAAAGFGEIEASVIDKISHAPDARAAAIGLCQGTPLRGEIEARDPGLLEQATKVSAQALTQRFGVGPIEGPMRAIVFEARR